MLNGILGILIAFVFVSGCRLCNKAEDISKNKRRMEDFLFGIGVIFIASSLFSVWYIFALWMEVI